MRVSVLKNDPGFRSDSGLWKATCDGVSHKLVVTADTDKGLIVRYKTDEHGIIIKPPEYETVHGIVILTRIADEK